jgi:hypothetical protein
MLKIFQQCKAADGWGVVEIPSSSEQEKSYTVVVADWGEGLCDCQGFNFRGHCKHIDKARQIRCSWEEGRGKCQTDLERYSRVCPECGGPTRIIAEED